MRAWQVQGAGEPIHVLHAIDVEVPEPSPGQLRIRVTAAGIGLPDVFMCRGTYPLTPPLPFTAGQEAAGVVTAAPEASAVSVARQMRDHRVGSQPGAAREDDLGAGQQPVPIFERTNWNSAPS